MYNEFDMGPKDVERINPGNVKNEPFTTDVEGVDSEAYYVKGIDKFPVFTVTDDEFNKSTDTYRRRISLSGKAGDYLKGARTNRPFYIKNSRNEIKKVS